MKGQLGRTIKLGCKIKQRRAKIENLKNIQRISYGCCGHHFLAQDSQNRIFVTGANYYG